MTDWEPGEPCPECGCPDIWEVHLQEQLSKHAEGDRKHLAYGDRLATVLYECDDCHTVLDQMDPDDIMGVIGE